MKNEVAVFYPVSWWFLKSNEMSAVGTFYYICNSDMPNKHNYRTLLKFHSH